MRKSHPRAKDPDNLICLLGVRNNEGSRLHTLEADDKCIEHSRGCTLCRICKRPNGRDWELGTGAFGRVVKGVRAGVQARATVTLL